MQALFSRLERVIDRRTAKMPGIGIAQSLLLRADELIHGPGRVGRLKWLYPKNHNLVVVGDLWEYPLPSSALS